MDKDQQSSESPKPKPNPMEKLFASLSEENKDKLSSALAPSKPSRDFSSKSPPLSEAQKKQLERFVTSSNLFNTSAGASEAENKPLERKFAIPKSRSLFSKPVESPVKDEQQPSASSSLFGLPLPPSQGLFGSITGPAPSTPVTSIHQAAAKQVDFDFTLPNDPAAENNEFDFDIDLGYEFDGEANGAELDDLDRALLGEEVTGLVSNQDIEFENPMLADVGLAPLSVFELEAAAEVDFGLATSPVFGPELPATDDLGLPSNQESGSPVSAMADVWLPASPDLESEPSKKTDIRLSPSPDAEPVTSTGLDVGLTSSPKSESGTKELLPSYGLAIWKTGKKILSILVKTLCTLLFLSVCGLAVWEMSGEMLKELSIPKPPTFNVQKTSLADAHHIQVYLTDQTRKLTRDAWYYGGSSVPKSGCMMFLDNQKGYLTEVLKSEQAVLQYVHKSLTPSIRSITAQKEPIFREVMELKTSIALTSQQIADLSQYTEYHASQHVAGSYMCKNIIPAPLTESPWQKLLEMMMDKLSPSPQLKREHRSKLSIFLDTFVKLDGDDDNDNKDYKPEYIDCIREIEKTLAHARREYAYFRVQLREVSEDIDLLAQGWFTMDEVRKLRMIEKWDKKIFEASSRLQGAYR